MVNCICEYGFKVRMRKYETSKFGTQVKQTRGGGFLELLGYWMDKVGLLRVMLITEVVVTAKTMETQI